MNCELCGTPVKVIGHTTKHYEPIGDNVSIVNLKNMDVAFERLCLALIKTKKVLEFYASGQTDLEPRPEKGDLYDKNYHMDSPEWRQRSMSDFISGSKARKCLEEMSEIFDTVERSYRVIK